MIIGAIQKHLQNKDEMVENERDKKTRTLIRGDTSRGYLSSLSLSAGGKKKCVSGKKIEFWILRMNAQPLRTANDPIDIPPTKGTYLVGKIYRGLKTPQVREFW